MLIDIKNILLFFLLSSYAYCNQYSLQGFWEMIDYNNGNAQYKVIFGSSKAYYDGLYITDSTITILNGIQFSDILFTDKKSKELQKTTAVDYINFPLNYTISNDSIFLTSKRLSVNAVWIIINHSADTLELRNDILNYNEIYVRKNYSDLIPLKFDKIKFSASYCLGNCPVYEIEIDSKGYLKYIGIDNIAYIGKFEYQLPDSLLNEFYQLFNIVDWKMLDSRYIGITHGPTFETEIYYDDKKIISISDWTGPVPCEMLWLYSFWKRLAKSPYKNKVE